VSDAIHNRIAMLRAERHISRRELSEALGVHYQTIGYLERGEFSPSLHLALRIADFFEVPLEVVFALRPFPRLGDPDDGSPPARTALRRGQAHQSEETTG
jgi:DNA-binding XRE family transcriptional regulator